MVDTLTPKERSKRMSLVRSKDTRPEKAVRDIVKSLGYRFQRHDKGLPGTPDLVFPELKRVIFVHGCFFHRHLRCPNTRTPKSRVAFWKKKFAENKKRDMLAKRRLTLLGWRYQVVWECETKKAERLTTKIRKFLKGRQR